MNDIKTITSLSIAITGTISTSCTDPIVASWSLISLCDEESCVDFPNELEEFTQSIDLNILEDYTGTMDVVSEYSFSMPITVEKENSTYQIIGSDNGEDFMVFTSCRVEKSMECNEDDKIYIFEKDEQ